MQAHPTATRSEAAAPPRRRLQSVLLIAAVTALAGCASAEVSEAEQTVRSFQQALRSDPGEACALLAPASRQEVQDAAQSDCATALQDAGLPDSGAVRAIDIAGHSARVVLDTDTVFLALFDDGWRITAAGCTPAADDALPYDCTVKGA